ncbi:hypothetical protein TR51_20215 [Kitasatospora griseola]|uniref:Uncharacterized protein n=1 Tax=Kitasatospora griseola TaxID=2064 RepID=A0A0D0NRB7_KITGR|nr:hypothetical protein [Kitasatospora griseola]KIQ61641.1 hypothetical protein TR51_20215 [Kitasatospora griseola]
MQETDRSRAPAGFTAAAVGAGIGLVLILLLGAGSALFGDGALPSSIVGLAILPVGGPMSSIWERRPVKRRPALLVALLLLVAVVLAVLGDTCTEDDGPGLGRPALGCLPGVLPAGAVFGTLCGEAADEPGRHRLRFTGRSRRLHAVVYGGPAVLSVLAVTATLASG